MAQKYKPAKGPVKKTAQGTPKKTTAAQPLPAKKGMPSLSKQLLLLALLALGLYVNTLNMDYALDDTLMIKGNQFTLKGVDGIGDIFTNDAFMGFLGKNNLLPGGRYRPLSQVLFALEYEMFGLNPFVGHLMNVIFYILLGLLLFIILRKLIPPKDDTPWFLDFSFIATALFIAHPLHTEVVANIKGRDEIMSFMGTLGALYFALRYVDTKKVINLLWTAVIFFLAILSKENALAYLVVIPLTIYFFRKLPFSKLMWTVLPLLLGIVAYIILRAATVGFVMKEVTNTELLNDPFLTATLGEKYATILYTWGKYFLLMLFPHPLTHDYYPKQIPLIGFADFRAIIPLLISLAMGFFAFWRLKGKHILSYAIFFFWLTFAMSSNLVINIGTFMNERFLFAPLLGFTIFLAWVINEPLKKRIRNVKKWSRLSLAFLLLILLAYGAKTITRNRVWQDDLTLFTTDVEVSVNSAKCNTSAGGKLMEYSDSISNPAQKRDLLERSLKYLNKSIEIYPTNLQTWILLGNAYIRLKDYPHARSAFHNCIKINPQDGKAYQNLLHIAQVTNKDSLYSESVITYHDLITLRPDSAQYIFGLGLAFKNALKLDSAIFYLNKTLEKDTNYGDAYGKLGEIYGQYYNDLGRSEAYLKKAVLKNPKDASSMENLGIVYAIKKDFPLSMEYFMKAYEITPENVGLNANIGKTYLQMGEQSKAQEFLNRAETLRKAGKE